MLESPLRWERSQYIDQVAAIRGKLVLVIPTASSSSTGVVGAQADNHNIGVGLLDLFQLTPDIRSSLADERAAADAEIRDLHAVA